MIKPNGPGSNLHGVHRTANLPPPPVTAKPAGAEAPADSASISQVPTTASGVKFQVTEAVKEGQKLVAVQAALPATPLLGKEMSLELVRDAGTGKVVSAKAQQGEQEFTVHPDNQGNMFITNGEAGSPWLYVDANPQSESFLKYGLTTEVQQGPGGVQQRAMQEYISPDGTATIIANEVVQPNGYKDYIQIDHSPQTGTYARQVEDRGGKPVDDSKSMWSAESMKESWKSQMGQMGSWFGKQGGTWKETALKVTNTPQGLVLSDDASDADRNKAGRRNADDMSLVWGKGMLAKFRGAPKTVATIRPFSWANQAQAQPQAPPDPGPQLPPGVGLPTA